MSADVGVRVPLLVLNILTIFVQTLIMDPKKLKKEAKVAISAMKKGGRYLKAAARKDKKAIKHASKSVSTKSHTKKTMQSEKSVAAKVSAARLRSAGSEAIDTGKTPPQKKSLVTTAQSAHKNLTSKDPYYSGSKRLRKEVRSR